MKTLNCWKFQQATCIGDSVISIPHVFGNLDIEKCLISIYFHLKQNYFDIAYKTFYKMDVFIFWLATITFTKAFTQKKFEWVYKPTILDTNFVFKLKKKQRDNFLASKAMKTFKCLNLRWTIPPSKYKINPTVPNSKLSMATLYGYYLQFSLAITLSMLPY